MSGGFSRRDVLGGAAAVGAGLLLGPASAHADAARASGRVASSRVGTVDGVSGVVVTGRAFGMAGVQWAAPASARIEMRARRRDGRWSPWGLASVRGHGPDREGGAGALSGEPLWFGPGCDAVQLRTSGPVGGLRVVFVAVAEDLVHGRNQRPGAAGLPLAQPVLPAGGGQPPIIARSAWAGSRHGPAAGPFYGAVELAFVHHSDNPNGYSAPQVPAMILALYDYHRYARGYFDIAYNFVIDAFGRVWEARAGGIDEPVIGAHAGGYNAVSTGVCMLGTFMSQLPSPAAIAALERLLGWKLPLHGVSVHGSVAVRVAPGGARYTRFRPNQRVTLPRIAGHRDGDQTDCPGNDLYARLPAIRRRVGRLVAGGPGTAVLTLAASVPGGPPGTAVTLSGTLTEGGGSPLPGEPVEIQTVSGTGRTTTIATVTTAPDGTWTAPPVTLERTLIVRALHAAAPAAVSNLVALGAVPTLTLALASASPLRVTGTVSPPKRQVTLRVYRLEGAHRRLVLSRRVAVRRDGTFSARLALGRRRVRGHYVVVARVAGDAVTVAGASPALPVTVA